ncbi:MAG: DUF2147 domain-containing protein [Catalinimonas sp.]
MKKALILTLVVLFFTPSLRAADPGAIKGVWLASSSDGNGDAHIRIYERGGRYYGKIVWLEEPNFPDGSPKVDGFNPDENLRDRPVEGLELLSGFEYDGDNVWEDGKVYNPEDGKTYSCKLTLVDPDKLEVRGYVGISLLGRTETWRRLK